MSTITNKKSIMTRAVSVAFAALLSLGAPGFVVHASEPCTHHEACESIDEVAPTCTEPGNYEYLRCYDCYYYLKTDRVTITTPEAETIPALGHSFPNSWEADDDEHWRACTRDCGREERYSHTFSILHSTGDMCDICGYIRPEHEHAYSSYAYDSNGHWQICTAADCDDATASVAHDINPATGKCSVCGYEQNLSSIRDGSSSSGLSSTTAVPNDGSEAIIAQIMANAGEPVVVETESLSAEIMDALSANPDATVVVSTTRNGEPISISIQDPIIAESVPYYGVENLIGIHNRSEIYHAFREMGFFSPEQLSVIRAQLRHDAIRAQKFEKYHPLILPPAGGNYIT